VGDDIHTVPLYRFDPNPKPLQTGIEIGIAIGIGIDAQLESLPATSRGRIAAGSVL
jgi:hypothetical protein